MGSADNAVFTFDGKEYRKADDGMFKVPLREAASLRYADIPPMSSISITELPAPSHFYSLSVQVTGIGTSILVRFTRSLYDPSISSSICIKRLRHIRQIFQRVVASGIVGDGVDHLERAPDGWMCGVLYMCLPGDGESPPVRDVVTPSVEAFARLVREEHRLLSICFASEDKPFVERLTSSLDEEGFDIWYERREVKADKSFAETLHRQTEEATHLVPVISKNSVSSSWLQSELSPSFAASIGGRSLPVIALIIDSSTLPAQVSIGKLADFRRDFLGGYRDLIGLLG